MTINSIDGSTTLPPNVPRTSVTPLSTAAGGNCTVSGGAETCTVSIPAPTGSVNYTFTVIDGSAQQNALATNTVTFTIAAGSNNPSLSVQLRGIVVTVSVTAPMLTPGTAFSGPIQVNGFDASGAHIVGSAPYANAITLTDTDKSGHTSLTVGSTTGLVVTVPSPQTVVILNYDGGPVQSFTIGASGPGQDGSPPVGGGGNVPVVRTARRRRRARAQRRFRPTRRARAPARARPTPPARRPARA